MFCRKVWQRLGPGVLRFFTPTFSKAPVRHMALGVPGGSTNMTYFVLCGGGLTAAVVYAYKTVNGDIERYEDRFANMASTAKADEEAAPEVIPVEQQVLASEAVKESVATPAEGAVEPVDESAAPEVDAGEVSEVLSIEEEEAAAEETVALEEVVEDILVTDEVETPTEAPSAEKSVPDLRTAVTILAGSSVEIAAASVGESSLVRAVRQIEEDRPGLESVLEVLEPVVLEVTKEHTQESAVATKEEEPVPAEGITGEENAGTEDRVAVEEIEEASYPAAEEKEVVPFSEAAENMGRNYAGDQTLQYDLKEIITHEDTSITPADPVDDYEMPVEETAVEDTIGAAEEKGAPETEVLSVSEPVPTPESNCHYDPPEKVMHTVGLQSENIEEGENKTNESREEVEDKTTESKEEGEDMTTGSTEEGEDKMTESTEEGEDMMTESRKEGEDKTTESRDEGEDKTTESTEEGEDKTTESRDEGEDKTTESAEEGEDKTTESRDEGEDKTTESAEEGEDKTTESRDEGEDKTTESAEEGEDKTTESAEEGEDKTTESRDEGEDKTTESAEEGEGKTIESTEEGEDKTNESRDEGEDKTNGSREEGEDKTETWEESEDKTTETKDKSEEKAETREEDEDKTDSSEER
ncbi:uncharacterized protein mgarpb isoform X2 [Nerophis ophidion]|uniref:uncharacterized protein mgarpb isoform X2 n=1 Tax=Nerophis ophidion TaxID=159077 RepID=UPI002AE06DE0|nr:uncharacterized protein mgarpb isoform X2 [Nerophis ophidion]